jgi:ribonuclease HI
VLAEKECITRLKYRKGWRDLAGPAAAEFAGINRKTEPTSIPPWNRLNISISRVDLVKKKVEYPTEQLKRMTEEKIEEIGADLRIFTDGSTSGRQSNGGAGFVALDRNDNVVHEECKPAGKLCSSFDGECVAVLAALQWIKNPQPVEASVADGTELRREDSSGDSEANTSTTNATPGPSKGKIAIFTDSESLVCALGNNGIRERHEWMKKIKLELSKQETTIEICWIPSHCGTNGNEKADKLAEEGSKRSQEDAPVTEGIVRAKIKNREWNIEHPGAKATFSERRKPDDREKLWPSDVRNCTTG